MRSVSRQMAVHSRHVTGRWKRLCQLHEAGPVARNVVWEVRGRTHSNGGAKGADGVESGREYPFPSGDGGWCETRSVLRKIGVHAKR